MQYASKTDLLTVGFPAQALGTLDDTKVNAALVAASEFADGYFRNRYGVNSVPFSAWDAAVTENVAKIAALRLLRIRGYNPESSADKLFLQGHNEAVAWLNAVQRQQINPKVTLASNANRFQNPSMISSSVVNLASGATGRNRGW